MRLHRLASDLPRSRMPLGLNVALALVVAVASAATFAVLLWLLLGRPPIRQVSGWTTANSFEFAKIVLALIGGVGAVVALVVAYRKQHLGEAAERREDIKLFAERFTKAADQLGSDKAPVRLAGMHALEDLAQGTRSQRQTIANVLCAYLRMPYLPQVRRHSFSSGAESATPSSIDETAGAESSQPVDQAERERHQQELQVRLTAQRILATHLRPGSSLGQALDTFWKDIDLDLTGATLVNLDFNSCHIRTAQFDGAEFRGDALFRRVEFSGDARFGGAEFDGDASFDKAEFSRDAWFGDARFDGDVSFGETKFGEDVSFIGARFDGNVSFGEAEFCGNGLFGEAEFGGSTSFTRVKFGGDVSFSGTEFGGDTWFDEAEFGANTLFGTTRFGGEASFGEARFGKYTWFRRASFGGNTSFRGTKFSEDASFDEARVRIDGNESSDERWLWPGRLAVADPQTEQEASMPDQDGRWGYLKPTASHDPKAGEAQT